MMKLESRKIGDNMEYVEIREDGLVIVIMQTENQIHIVKYKNERELLERFLTKIGEEKELMKELKDLEIENEILKSEVDCLYEELDEIDNSTYDVDFEETECDEDCIICEELRRKQHKEGRDEI